MDILITGVLLGLGVMIGIKLFGLIPPLLSILFVILLLVFGLQILKSYIRIGRHLIGQIKEEELSSFDWIVIVITGIGILLFFL